MMRSQVTLERTFENSSCIPGGGEAQDAARNFYDKSSVGEKHAMERILAVAHRIHEDKALVALTSSPSSSCHCGNITSFIIEDIIVHPVPAVAALKMVTRLDVAAGSSGDGSVLTIDMEQATGNYIKGCIRPTRPATFPKQASKVKVC